MWNSYFMFSCSPLECMLFYSCFFFFFAFLFSWEGGMIHATSFCASQSQSDFNRLPAATVRWIQDENQDVVVPYVHRTTGRFRFIHLEWTISLFESGAHSFPQSDKNMQWIMQETDPRGVKRIFAVMIYEKLNNDLIHDITKSWKKVRIPRKWTEFRLRVNVLNRADFRRTTTLNLWQMWFFNSYLRIFSGYLDRIKVAIKPL